jgi:TRL-like protein family
MQAGAVAKNGEVGEKVGESTRHSTLFGLVEWGNNGVGEAANQGGIKEVRTVQNGGIDVLWGVVYSEQTTLVTGASEYVNHLPLKIPKEGKVLQEGLYLEANGNLAVKNSQNQTLDLIKHGEISRKIKLDQQQFAVSYGFENTGKRTILITPVDMKMSNKFLINDQIVTFVPKSSLVMVLGNKMSVREYKSVPEGLLRIEPVIWWEEQLTTNERISNRVAP